MNLDAFVYPGWGNPPRLIGDLSQAGNTPLGTQNLLVHVLFCSPCMSSGLSITLPGHHYLVIATGHASVHRKLWLCVSKPTCMHVMSHTTLPRQCTGYRLYKAK